MSRRVSSSQSNQRSQMPRRGLSPREISEIEGLSMLEQAEKIKSILESTKENNHSCLVNKIDYELKLDKLQTENPKNMEEINIISMAIHNLQTRELKFEKKINELESNLAERIRIMDELSKSRYGKTLVFLPAAPKGRGKKKKRTHKRKKRKKRKTKK
tara:strand:+ start:4755 stop:5228 length:474 start_codon:yes stop_codon:yes gene_type:complete